MDWHALSEKEVFEELNSSLKGLNEEEVDKRLHQYGHNVLKKTKHFDALKIFLNQFKSFLILILIFAAILSIFMKSLVDSIVIFAILILNAGLGFTQEYKAEKAIEQLKKMMVSEAKIIRGGKIMKIDSKYLVPGDILVLDEGDKIMADARVIESDGLNVNESALTGESVPILKISKKISLKTALAERIDMVYQGTSVVSGSGKAVVVNTGMTSEFGRISELVQEIKSEENPFKEKLDNFAKKIGIIILFLSALIVVLLVWNGIEVFQSLLVAVSLAVAAIPEGLPAVVSLGLAFATKRMLAHKVLVRKLPASETLGRVTVICTDKTGTLTQERMRVTEIYSNGDFNSKKGSELLFKIGILCNKARQEINGKEEYLIGDPTEQSLIIAAKENFLNKKELTEKNPKFKEFPFNSTRKMMSVIRKTDNKLISYVKGAPEKILSKSNYEFINDRTIRLTEDRRKELTESYEKMAKKGLRVLGFSYKVVGKENISEEEAESNLIFVGFQGMIDPPRQEVENAIKLCKDAGIKVLMITGDNKLTATAVASEIGLHGKTIDSKELAEMSDYQLFNEINNIAVFSRSSPESKLRIINILKKKNEIVAMTGDGVNDVLALKRADIGIAMGIRGTDVARDSSDIVLLDDNFASIVNGIKEGRGIYDNTKKFIKLLLAVNFSELLLVLFVMLAFRNPAFLPLLPLQILWINLITDSLPALALTVEPTEKDVMKRKPNREGILYGITGFLLLGGIIAFIINVLAFSYYGITLENMDKARTLAVTSSILFQIIFAFNCKSNGPVFKSAKNKYLIYAVLASLGIHLVALYTPLSKVFSFVKLGVLDWIILFSMCLLGFAIIELSKYTIHKRNVFKEPKISINVKER
ncbi:MAG: cation-translocating P-type ATPase [Candidatus Pacearchaeota archaeon]